MNSPALLKKTIEAVYEKGSALEYEVVEASSLHRLMRYAEEGLFDRDRDNMWLLHGGGFGATPPIARNVLFAIDEGLRLFPKAIWGVTATGATCSGSSRWACRWAVTWCVWASRTASTCPTAVLRATTARWCARPRSIAAIYGLTPATVEEARARFRI